MSDLPEWFKFCANCATGGELNYFTKHGRYVFGHTDKACGDRYLLLDQLNDADRAWLVEHGLNGR